VIETPDAVLVVDKRCTQDVRQVVAHLAQTGHTLAHQHRKEHRPWGWYDRIDSGERFQVKRIVVNPGASLSLQMHRYRAEHWVVVKGVAEVTHGERCFRLHENESTYIPLGHIHRLGNPGSEPLEIIEIQSGSYLGEDDIVRFDDAYGRAPQVG
jgi:mannose-1-phosphate guanylyltransferase/mannose-6-phosphate isomerase